MVEHAKDRLGNAVDVRLHDLRKPLSFLGDDSVDVVLAALVMDYIEDWAPVFGEFRRVLMGDGALVFSVGHPAFEFIKDIGMKDYWSVERVEIWWKTWGEPVLVPSYRRPLQAITDPLREAGFLLERLVEARPTMEYKEADPEGYEEVSKRPSFVCIKAIPDPRKQ